MFRGESDRQCKPDS
uniref:Uncharacterized protein n=1 Tax=Anguilla anguilla TaxID=7936 RepID=A0A0E9Y0F3_ANGAN